MRSTLMLLISAQLLVPMLAQADVIPPEFAACDDLKEGDACTMTEGVVTPLDGTCQIGQKCSLDYSNLCDSGAPCGTICSDALMCKASTKDAGAADKNTSTANKDASTANRDASTAEKVDSDSGSCAVPSRSLPLSSGIFFLLGLLLIMRLRRS